MTEQVAGDGERGLLGVAFHPNYAQNGLFYLHFSSNGSGAVPLGNGIIAEFAVAASDPDHADPLSQRQLLEIAKPEPNHNGGMLAFGADGLLYLGIGDGGGGNDQHGPIGNGQALDTFLGKLLRIDVDARDAGAYGIPPGNLAEATGLAALPEIWAYGLRNPWRFGFDPCNADLYIGDVGQNTLEEIDYLPGGTAAGTNFGWRIMEGNVCRPGGGACDSAGLTLPVDTYPRSVGASVTGGYVYRGSAIPGLRGHYLYGDFISSRSFRFRIEAGSAVDRQEISAELRPGSDTFGNIASFGQDNAGELYVAAFTPGAVYRVVAAP
jgi:glucose/arabinose dehydrogenase